MLILTIFSVIRVKTKPKTCTSRNLDTTTNLTISATSSKIIVWISWCTTTIAFFNFRWNCKLQFANGSQMKKSNSKNQCKVLHNYLFILRKFWIDYFYKRFSVSMYYIHLYKYLGCQMQVRMMIHHSSEIRNICLK